jgi:V-type H+-transporting ATPase subunit a
MLCTKPYLLYREHKKIKEQGYHGIGTNGDMLSGGEDESDGDATGGHAVVAEEMDEEHEFDMGEHVIHQVIRECRPSLSHFHPSSTFPSLFTISLHHC